MLELSKSGTMTISNFPFTLKIDEDFSPGVYKPVPPNPSGVRMAWLLFGITFVIGVPLLVLDFALPLIFWFAFAILFIIALAISFSHWLESRTWIVIEEDAIRYRSPLRTVSLAWGEIDELRVGAIQGGWRFMVSSTNSAFRFQSLVVFRSGSGREVRSGFKQGEQIADHIHQKAGLEGAGYQDGIWIFRRQTWEKTTAEGVLR
jgi:hypothetical protein